jgi:hypothetical protein
MSQRSAPPVGAHRWYPPRLRHDGEPARQVGPVQRHREEEAQGRDRAVDARRLHADPRLVQSVPVGLFGDGVSPRGKWIN